jgi:hypothetical protein
MTYIQSDSDLRDAVRAETSYDDTEDELPQSQLDTLIDRAKHRVSVETGSEQWYSDDGLGLVLVAYTCMRTKSSMENFAIEEYSLGNQDITTRNADPEDSQQIQQWAEDVRVGLDRSTVDESPTPKPRNTAHYVGENYVFNEAEYPD